MDHQDHQGRESEACLNREEVVQWVLLKVNLVLLALDPALEEVPA